MTTPTNIEKVADAIALADRLFKKTNKAAPDYAARAYEAMAKAAVLAIREPTEAACADDHGRERWGWTCHTCGGPKENWETTIDRILEGH